MVDLISVVGQESFTRMVTPLAFEACELKNIFCGVHFWWSLSVCRDVRVSSRTNRFEGDLFILLCIFILLDLSPNELMFQEVILIVSSGDFEGEVFSSIVDFVYGDCFF